MFYLKENDKIMKIQVSDVSAFRSIFLCITRFIEKAHFDVQKTGIRIRSIDHHDFCYIDLFLRQEFFEGYDLNGKVLSFGADCANIISIFLTFSKHFVKEYSIFFSQSIFKAFSRNLTSFFD